MRRSAPSVALTLRLATACASGPPLTVEEPVAVVAERQVSERQASVVDPCAGHDDLFIEPVARIEADWQGAVTIGGTGPVTVRWCGEGEVTVASVTLGRPREDDGPEALYIREPDETTGRLAHGQALTLAMGAPPVQEVLEIVAIAHAGPRILLARASVEVVDDPERAALRGECVAAGGEWSGHGLAGVESCDRPTRDAGQRCTSDADCEGPCLEAGTEPFTGQAPAGVVVPTCGRGAELRLVVGRCAERSLRFGCRALLEDGRVECVTPGFARRSHVICVD